MDTRRALRRSGALSAACTLIAAVSCLDPTEVTLVVTTDVQCPLDRGTSITVGSTGDDLSVKPPLTVTQDCTGGSKTVDDAGTLTSPASIGTLVVVPSGSKSDSFAVRVVMAVDPNMSPMDCVAPAYTNCIVADREVSFIPHTPITLPIEVTLDCKNIVCSKGLTCVHGQCTTDVAHVNCGGGGCEGVIPLDASATDVGALPADSSSDASMSDVATADQQLRDVAPEWSSAETSTDATMDAVADVGQVSDGGPPSDASPLGACVSAGTSNGLQCGGTTCEPGLVCCVAFYPTGAGQTTETCTTLSACNYNAASATIVYSALACRNVGDCPAGSVCCGSSSTMGAGSLVQCATTCPYSGVGMRTTVCKNSCECAAAAPYCNAKQCMGYTVGLCGGMSGSACL
jgi:hypothetical protein